MIKLTQATAQSTAGTNPKPTSKPQAEDSPATETVPSKPTPALIVFGSDKDGKPHASWFAEPDVVLATKAAAVMGMRILPLASEAGLAIAAQLPQGRVFASGRAFVPFTAKDVYARLTTLAGKPATETLAGGSASAEGAAKAPGEPPMGKRGREAGEGRYPRSWAGIAVGSLVLISEGEQDGWYEAEVVEAKVEGIYTLRWRDWPDLPLLVRRRERMALLHPNTPILEPV